ncbi:uncharacterized protein LOC103569071 [Microplitis demolitor]|uniref:uncharacterized protein LOC103569071 n=1 Tax=Microplitis demolitor TaxID=69319 RepID=UPI0004CDD2C7|nr:uncharacterized protein LOC103569071 [Microplitis demolitor]
MEKLQVNSCCGCFSLKTGTLFTGICGIILSIITLILLFTVNMELKMIVLDILDKSIIKIIFAINLCMTILISTLLIVGALKKNTFMMLPWVVLGIMLAIGALVSVLYTSIASMVNHKILNGVLSLIIGLIFVAIYTYLWVVVYCYFQQLRMEKMNVKVGPYGRPYNYRRP